jgi:alkylated DNA repair dioxygenase AlkB
MSTVTTATAPPAPLLQPSLLDLQADPTLGELGDGIGRRSLAHGAWVDLRRGWLSGADALFDALVAHVPWHEERRRMYDRTVQVPRLLAFYDEAEPLPHPVLTLAREELDRHYRHELREPFVTAGLCLYRDGRDSVAWHGDTIGRGSREDTMVAILSVGAPRALLLRPRDRSSAAGRPAPGAHGSSTLRLELGHGDLIVMGGSCQRTWEHAVPKTARPVGPRISIQFRPRGVR